MVNRNTEQANDQELIARFLNDDLDSFNQLYERYKKQLYAYLNRMLPGQYSLVDDIFQQTWLRVIHKLPDYRHDRKFLAWIMRISHNLAMDHFRKHRRESNVEEFDSSEIFSQSGNEPWRDMDKRELGRAIDNCIGQLPPEQREVFLMRQENVPFKEIAVIQDCSINTVLGRMQYAIRNLQKLLCEWKESNR